MNLWVDIGNTRIKLAAGPVDDMRDLGAVNWRDADAVAQLQMRLQGLRAEHAVVSNVADAAPLNLLLAAVPEKTAPRVLCLQNTRDVLGLSCGYADRRHLGVDRWFAMLGAWQATQSALCVVDVGTAGTADCVDASGQHLGGCIFAGVQTQRLGLQRHAAQLDAVEATAFSLFNDNTADAIAAGTALSVAATVDRLCDEAERALPGPIHCVLTGGGAALVRPLLRRVIHYEPLLVMHGLAAAWNTQNA